MEEENNETGIRYFYCPAGEENCKFLAAYDGSAPIIYMCEMNDSSRYKCKAIDSDVACPLTEGLNLLDTIIRYMLD